MPSLEIWFAISFFEVVECYNRAGSELSNDKELMQEHPDFHAKLIPNRMGVRWNALFAQLSVIWQQTAQIKRTYDTIPVSKARDLPILDDEYWVLVEEHIALLHLFLHANPLFTVEDKPTLAPTLIAVFFLKESLAAPARLTLSDIRERLRPGDCLESARC